MNNFIYSMSFCGVKENIKIGKDTIKALRTEIGKPQSSTYLDTKIMQQYHNPNKDHFVYRLKDLSKAWEEKMQSMYDKYFEYQDNPPEDLIPRLKEMVKKYKMANCDIQSLITKDELEKRGENAHIFCIDIIEKPIKFLFFKITDVKILKCNHMFTMIGLDEKFIPNKPETWGENAVMVDAWSERVLAGKEAFQWLKKFFKFNPEKEEIKIREMIIDSDSIKFLDSQI